MKKLIKKVKVVLLYTVLLSFTTIDGCGNTQSNEVINVGDFGIELVDSNRLDVWKVSGDTQGTDICGAAFGFIVRLYDILERPLHDRPIMVKVEVTGHWDTYHTGNGDIWERNAPNGKEYGFIVSEPQEGSDTEDGVFYCWTDEQGIVKIFPGLGQRNVLDGNAPLDYGFKWPGPGAGYNDIVDTWVQLKITVPRRREPLPPRYIWVHFVRAQYQNFWEPSGGVYGNSVSGLGELEGFDITDIDFTDASPQTAVPYVKSSAPATPKDNNAKYPLVSRTKPLEAGDSVISPNSIDLTQLRWDPNYGWAYFLIEPNENLHALWIYDLNSPNQVSTFFNLCQPYTYWVVFNSDIPFYPDSATATLHLRALQSPGDVRSMIPLKFHLYDKSPDNKTLTFRSDWFIISEDTDFTGQYEDDYNNPYTVIYMPEGTYPDIDLPPNGDFNADGYTDYRDLFMLSSYWLSMLDTTVIEGYDGLSKFAEYWLNDCNENNQWCRSCDRNQSGRVDFLDFADFAGDWMKPAVSDANDYDLLYEDPNNVDGSIDFRDFTAFADNWMDE